MSHTSEQLLEWTNLAVREFLGADIPLNEKIFGNVADGVSTMKKFGRLANEQNAWLAITCIAHALALVPGDVAKLVGKQLATTQESHGEWVPVVQRCAAFFFLAVCFARS